MVPAWTWGRIAAGAVIAVGSGTSVWNLGRASSQPRVSEALKALQDEKLANQELAADNLTLRDNARRLSAHAITQAPSVGVPSPGRSGQDDQQIMAMQRQLAEAQAATAAAVQSFADGRLRVSELEKDLRDRSSQLVIAGHNLEDAERRYHAAVQQADQERQQRDQQETQIASAQVRIRELENEVTQFRRVMEKQQQSVVQNLQLIAMLQSPSASLVRLRATEAGQMASGMALFTDRSRLVFFASNLPTPAAGRTYQLWLVRKRGPAIVSAGTFSRTGANVPAVQFTDPALLTGITGLAVTDEPAGGSPLPTGHKWLIGTPQS